MQGSIVHLQAEIRRLKEIIELRAAAAQPSAGLPAGADVSKYEQYFVHAMTLKQHLQQENKVRNKDDIVAEINVVGCRKPLAT